MISPRFGQLYIASPEAAAQLRQHYRDTNSTLERCSGKLLREMTGDETIPDFYPVALEKAPAIRVPLVDGRTLILTNKGYPDKDEFVKLDQQIRQDRAAIYPSDYNRFSTSDVADVHLMNRQDAGADIQYIGYDEPI